MPEMTASSMAPRKERLASFTLIELLTVMAIIAILAALTLAAGSGVWQKAARSRAAGEIQAISTALESYKTDNGIYPPSDGTLLLTNSAAASYFSTTLDGTSTAYQTNSQILYQALSGQTNYNDTPVAGSKSYMAFKIGQLGNNSAAAGTTGAGSTYIRDPWNYSYGYSTGTTNNAPTPSYPYNGSGFFDLWSTGGLLKASVNTNAWINNWQQQ
jgi:prepilin-type N-terminal cleavage/methylation domain-containing protein